MIEQHRMTLDEWLEFNEKFRYMGLTLAEIRQAVTFARSHNWKPVAERDFACGIPECYVELPHKHETSTGGEATLTGKGPSALRREPRTVKEAPGMA